MLREKLRRPRARSKGYFLASAGLAALMVNSVASLADDLTIDSDTTTPVSTSTGDGTGPGNITITNEGEIVIDTAEAVVTIDSSHTLLNLGNIRTTATAGGTGINILTGLGITSSVTIEGSVIAGPDSGTDSTGANYGIVIQGTGTFTGDLTTGSLSNIAAIGPGSVAIDIRAPMIGNITNAGAINFLGDGAIGIRINNTLTGDIINSGSIASADTDAVGIAIFAPVSGVVSNRGAIAMGSGARLDEDFNVVAGESALAAVLINADLGGGFINDQQIFVDDPDTTENEAANSFAGSIESRGSGAAILITTKNATDGDRDVTLGLVGSGSDAFGLINKSAITSVADFAGINSLGIRIEGSSDGVTNYMATIEGGFLNTLRLTATARDGDATALHIGDFASVPLISNSSSISASSTFGLVDTDGDGFGDENGPGGDAYGIIIDAQANVQSIINSGLIGAQTDGAATTAIAVIDFSGTLTSITNSGAILAGTPIDSTGQAVAIDLSNNTSGITINNSGDIIGDVFLGSGMDTVSMDGGTLAGDLDFGGGGGSFTLLNGARFVGALTNTDGLALNIVNSTLDLAVAPTPVQVDSFFVDATSLLSIQVEGALGQVAGLNIVGEARFEAGARIETDFQSFGFENQSFELINAGNLIFEGGPGSVEITGESALFRTALFTVDDVRDSLFLTLELKSVEELGLTDNQSALFDAAKEVLPMDTSLGASIANMQDIADVKVVFDQMMPDVVSGASREAAIINNNATFSAISGRIQSLRDLDIRGPLSPRFLDPEEQGVSRFDDPTSLGFSIWGEEIFYTFDQDASAQHFGFDGNTLGFAFGVDKPAIGLDALGVGLVQTWTEFKDDFRLEDRLLVTSTQLLLYGTKSIGSFYVDVAGGVAYNAYDSNRRTQTPEEVRTVKGEWGGLQLSANASTGYRIDLGPLGITASTGISYIRLHENSTDEKNGGSGINLHLDSRTTTSLRWNAGVELDAVIRSRTMVFVPRLRAGITRELDNDALTFGVRFVDGLTPFQLSTPKAERNLYNGGVSLNFLMDEAMLSFSVDIQKSDTTLAKAATVSFRVHF